MALAVEKGSTHKAAETAAEGNSSSATCDALPSEWREAEFENQSSQMPEIVPFTDEALQPEVSLFAGAETASADYSFSVAELNSIETRLNDHTLPPFTRAMLVNQMSVFTDDRVKRMLLSVVRDPSQEESVRTSAQLSLNMAIGSSGGRSIAPDLLVALDDPGLDAERKKHLSFTVQHVGGKEVREHYLSALHNGENSEKALEAVSYLKQSCTYEAREPFLEIARNRNASPEVRAGVLMALEQIYPEEALPIARKILLDSSESDHVRGISASVLGGLGDKDAAATLFGILTAANTSEHVRFGAAIGLSSLKDERARPYLMRKVLSLDAEPQHRAGALFSIGALEKQQDFSTLYEIGMNPAAPYILRHAAVEILSRRGEPSANEVYTSVLEGAPVSYGPLYSAATQGLIIAPDERALPFLVQRASSIDLTLPDRVQAVRALTALGSEQALSALYELRHDEVPTEVRLAAAEGLARHKDERAKELLSGSDLNNGYALNVVRAGALLGTHECWSAIIDYLNAQHPDLRMQSARAVSEVLREGNNFSNFIDWLRKEEESPTTPGDMRPFGAYADALLEAGARGAEYPLRFSLDTLVRMYSKEQEMLERPLAVIVAAKADEGGAFFRLEETAKKLLSEGYRIEYAETDNDAGVALALRDATQLDTLQETRAKLIIFAGHGSQKGTQYGQGMGVYRGPDRSPESLDVGDEEFLVAAGVSRALEDNGQIILYSCSTGEGENFPGDNLNMANMMRRVFPQAKPQGIHGPIEPAMLKELEFEQGELSKVQFTVPAYQALRVYGRANKVA